MLFRSFNNAVSVTPVCAPYRASLLTGKYTSSTGMVINELNMNPNHKTIAHVLTESGYSTGYVGKVHLNDQHNRNFPKGPERLGFDDFWAGYSFNHQSFKGFYYTDDEGGNEIKVDLTGKYEPEVTTGLALDYLKIQAKKNKPFALFLSWNPPHDPWLNRMFCPNVMRNSKKQNLNFLPTSRVFLTNTWIVFRRNF